MQFTELLRRRKGTYVIYKGSKELHPCDDDGKSLGSDRTECDDEISGPVLNYVSRKYVCSHGLCRDLFVSH